MFDNFINSFCKVQFLCYQGEPNWMGLIVLIPLAIMVFAGIVFLFTTIFGAIFKGIGAIFIWLSDTSVELYNEARNVFKKRPKRKQSELEHLNRKQKVFRIISLPFELIIWLFSVLLVLLIILLIVGLVFKLAQVIYNYII